MPRRTRPAPPPPRGAPSRSQIYVMILKWSSLTCLNGPLVSRVAITHIYYNNCAYAAGLIIHIALRILDQVVAIAAGNI